MKSFLKRLIIVIATTIAVLSVFALALFIYFEPRRNGLNMKQWLQVLKTEKKSTNSPLLVIRVKETEGWAIELELPLSFDLMLTNELIYEDGVYKNAKISFLIDNRDLKASIPERSTNGNCIFRADKEKIHNGTNQIQAHMTIAQPENKDRPLRADGPIFNYVSTNLFFTNSPTN